MCVSRIALICFSLAPFDGSGPRCAPFPLGPKCQTFIHPNTKYWTTTDVL